MTNNYLSFFGLCSDIVGALLILSGVFLSKQKALEVGVPRYASDKPEENLKLPSVANLLFQSRQAVFGTVFLLLGFVLQAAAVWPFK